MDLKDVLTGQRALAALKRRRGHHKVEQGHLGEISGAGRDVGSR